MTEDAENVIHKYKCAIFTAPLPSQSGREAVELCKMQNIPYIVPNEEKAY